LAAGGLTNRAAFGADTIIPGACSSANEVTTKPAGPLGTHPSRFCRKTGLPREGTLIGASRSARGCGCPNGFCAMSIPPLRKPTPSAKTVAARRVFWLRDVDVDLMGFVLSDAVLTRSLFRQRASGVNWNWAVFHREGTGLFF